MTYETILYAEGGAIGWLTLNRPDDGNMFTPAMCHEIRDRKVSGTLPRAQTSHDDHSKGS